MKEELVSIIVPIYNAESFLERCVNSIIKQDYNNLEIILINDGSTDSSEKICKKMVNNDKRIIFISKKNEGVSKSRNLGLNIAKGKYIFFADADDYLEQNMISKMVSSIQKNNVDIVIINYYPNNNTKLPDFFSAKEAMNLILNKKYFKGYTYNKLYKKENIKNTRFREDIYIAEDLLFNCEYLLNIKKCAYIDEKLYHYEWNENSATRKELNEKYLSILKAYGYLEKIYKENCKENLIYLYIDMFKICCDIIYRNSKNNSKKRLVIDDVRKKKRELYNKLMKSDIKIIKKIEIFIYNIFPKSIGKLKEIKKIIKNNHI